MMATIFQQEKDANVIAYLKSHIKKMPRMKLYKLLFFIDELSLERSGKKITSFNYRAWEKGPVPSKLDRDLKEGEFPQPYYEYLSFSNTKDSQQSTIEVINVDTDVFSDFEIGIINEVIDILGGKSKEELSELSHREGSLWHKFYQPDKNGHCNKFIDMNLAIKDDKLLAEIGVIEEFKRKLSS